MKQLEKTKRDYRILMVRPALSRPMRAARAPSWMRALTMRLRGARALGRA